MGSTLQPAHSKVRRFKKAVSFLIFMEEYSIHGIIIQHRYFALNGVMSLRETVELARDLQNLGVLYHIDQKISEHRFEHRSLSDLERQLGNKSRN